MDYGEEGMGVYGSCVVIFEGALDANAEVEGNCRRSGAVSFLKFAFYKCAVEFSDTPSGRFLSVCGRVGTGQAVSTS